MQAFAQSLWEAVLPLVSTILVTIAIPALVAVSLKWFQKLGVDVSATQRDTYQSALTNAAGVIIQRLGPKAATLTDLPRMVDLAGGYTPEEKAVKEAIERVKKAAPDGIAHFDIKPADIARGLEAKLGILTGPTDAAGAPVAAKAPPNAAVVAAVAKRL